MAQFFGQVSVISKVLRFIVTKKTLGDCGMEIKLSDFYPFYKTNEDIEVSDEVYNTLLSWKREDIAYHRQLYRKKAYYSLDVDDGLEHKAVCNNTSPCEIIIDKMEKHELYTAVTCLPGKLAKRVYAYFFLDMSENEIAKIENVSQQSVSKAIQRALVILEKSLRNSNENEL